MSTTAPARRRAGRPPKIAQTVRKWLYVSGPSWNRAADRALAEGRDLPDVMRAFLDAYADGSIAAPTALAEETS